MSDMLKGPCANRRHWADDAADAVIPLIRQNVLDGEPLHPATVREVVAECIFRAFKAWATQVREALQVPP